MKLHRKTMEIFSGLAPLVFIISVSLPMPVSAEMTFGRLSIKPEIALQETYRSNIYQAEHHEKSDWITSVVPGFNLNYTFGQHSLAVDYYVDFLNYARYSKNNYQDHRANGLLNLALPADLQMSIEDHFTRSSFEISPQQDRQRPYHQNLFNSTLAYVFADRWKAEVKYNRDDLSFDATRDRESQYTSNLVGGTFYYRFLPRTSALVEYDYLTKDFVGYNTSDHKDHLLYGGIAFAPRGKLRGSFRAGYGWKDFDQHLSTRRDNSPQTWIVAAQIVEDFSPRTSLTFDAIRALADDSDVQNASYINTSAGLTGQHYFTSKIGASVSAAYRQGDYLDYTTEPITEMQKKRNDKVWTFGGAAFYDIQKWLQVRIEYEYITKNSNFETYSFDEHRAFFKVAFSL
jgi:polysaccharide biosynthesis protein VpsM